MDRLISRRLRSSIAWAALALLLVAAPAQADPTSIAELAAAQRPLALRVAAQLWDWAELGYLEERSSALLRSELQRAGFAIESPVAGLPTAFVASAGSGAPVVAILAEFDALPGISQAAVPRKEARAERSSAHACGHNLFGGGSLAAAVAVARWLEASGTGGTVRVVGTPAEEGGSGKVYLVRAGVFDDVDAALHWHPSDRNDASPVTNLANKSAKFRFRGIASHAALAPERGRSALDGVEAMDHMVNMLREHVSEATRIHYVITEGGKAPNVVPEFAEVFYYVRHPDPARLRLVWDRVVSAAQGAAQGTGTEVDFEVIHGNHSLLPNQTLAQRMLANAQAVGGPVWDEPKLRFARAMRETLQQRGTGDLMPLGSERSVMPYRAKVRKSSTDVGDVSWTVPTAGFSAATWPPGTAPHTWQSAAASGAPIAEDGMMVAAQVLARTAIDLFRDPALIGAARLEFDRARGPGYRYQALLGDRDPPLDYRR